MSDGMVLHQQRTTSHALSYQLKWPVFPKFIEVQRVIMYTNSKKHFRIFCFSYAGGSAVPFRTWRRHLPSIIDVHPLELPGHGARLHEPLLRSIPEIVEDLTSILLPYLDQPFAFFGHSMGALVCFEVACSLLRKYGLCPEHLFVSAHRAPHLPSGDSTTHMLPDNELIQYLQCLDGTPAEALEDHQVTELMLPIVRADLEACNLYQYSPKTPLPCAITALGGKVDRLVTVEQLDAWIAQTEVTFERQTLPGSHFYLQEHQTLFIKTLADKLRCVLSGIHREQAHMLV